LRQSDYQRHLAEIKKQKEEYEAARKKFNEASEQFKITKAQYDEWDKLLKGRPEIYRQLLNAAKSPAQPKEIFEQAQGYTDQTVSEVRKELEELRAWRDSMEASKHRQAAIANLKAKYPDADEQAITEVIKGMTEGGLDGLLDTAYHSIKGRSLSPAQVADRIARGMEKNKGATLSEPGQQSNSGRKYKNTDEAMKAAYNDFGLATL
jgi:Xaa-Pro aminopeptidase